jgi:DNA polymerase elongation subunit (family B)
MNTLTLPPTLTESSSSMPSLILQVLQWIFETDFVYLFCKSQVGQRYILKVHSLNLKSYILVDDATSLTENLCQEFDNFLTGNGFQSKVTFKKRFGTFFDSSGTNHQAFKFVKITHPNGKPLYTLRNMLKSFESKHHLSLKSFHMKIGPIVRIFQHNPNLKPCMFVELDTNDPLVKCIPHTTARYSKGLRYTTQNYKADGMYSLPISKLHPCHQPPPFNFPIRIVAFDFECSGANFEKDCIYQASFVFETVGRNVDKDVQRFLLNVGDCAPIAMEDNSKVTVKSFPTEKELLCEVISLLVQNEWDCITGYNIYGNCFFT